MPELGALVDDLAEQLDAHDALPAVHLVARAEHALGVADVRAFDLDDLRQARRAIAPGREQQPAHRLRLRAQQRSAARRARALMFSGAAGMLALLLAEVLDDARQNLVELDRRLVADRAP